MRTIQESMKFIEDSQARQPDLLHISEGRSRSIASSQYHSQKTMDGRYFKAKQRPKPHL